jgi:hypothetical protein
LEPLVSKILDDTVDEERRSERDPSDKRENNEYARCVVFPNELSGSGTWLQAPVEEKADRNESKTE